MFFLTDIDPRAAVKGSRDPLGFQPIWTRFGREIVGNLTTVTGSLRNFTVLMLGLHFAERAIRDGKADESQRADLFLKFEQLAAYSRYAKLGDEVADGILGVRRIRRRFNEKQPLRISAQRDAQLLSNQKTYGIWGLYSVAGAESGLCDDYCLTPHAEEAVEHEYLPRLVKGCGKDGSAIVRYLVKDGSFEPNGRDGELATSLASVLGPRLSKQERVFYSETLVLRSHGSDRTHGRQGKLWNLLQEVNAKQPFGWSVPFGLMELAEVLKRARAKGQDDLACELDQIAVLEPVLAAGRRLFLFCFTAMADGSRRSRKT